MSMLYFSYVVSSDQTTMWATQSQASLVPRTIAALKGLLLYPMGSGKKLQVSSGNKRSLTPCWPMAAPMGLLGTALSFEWEQNWGDLCQASWLSREHRIWWSSLPLSPLPSQTQTALRSTLPLPCPTPSLPPPSLNLLTAIWCCISAVQLSFWHWSAVEPPVEKCFMALLRQLMLTVHSYSQR